MTGKSEHDRQRGRRSRGGEPSSAGCAPAFMVERYLPATTGAALAEAARQAEQAAITMSAEGVPVRYLCSMFAPSDEWCFCLFTADSSASVRQAHLRLGIPFDRVVEIVMLEADDA
jgi:uncharacterized protein DUF4242